MRCLIQLKRKYMYLNSITAEIYFDILEKLF